MKYGIISLLFFIMHGVAVAAPSSPLGGDLGGKPSQPEVKKPAGALEIKELKVERQADRYRDRNPLIDVCIDEAVARSYFKNRKYAVSDGPEQYEAWYDEQYKLYKMVSEFIDDNDDCSRIAEKDRATSLAVLENTILFVCDCLLGEAMNRGLRIFVKMEFEKLMFFRNELEKLML